MINDWVIATVFLIVILILIVITIVIGIKTPKHVPTWRERYNAYISSSKWRKRRSRALMLGNYECANCGSKRNLHVHHLSYEHFTKEFDSELQVLCRKCHQDVHKRKF